MTDKLLDIVTPLNEAILALAEKNAALEQELEQWDKDWLILLQAISTFDSETDWHNAGDDVLREQFDPYAMLRLVEQQAERLEDGHRRIVEWAKAYPLDVFPEPDFEKAAQVLKDAGMTLDAISASNMRHVVEGVGNIAKDALASQEEALEQT